MVILKHAGDPFVAKSANQYAEEHTVWKTIEIPVASEFKPNTKEKVIGALINYICILGEHAAGIVEDSENKIKELTGLMHSVVQSIGSVLIESLNEPQNQAVEFLLMYLREISYQAAKNNYTNILREYINTVNLILNTYKSKAVEAWEIDLLANVLVLAIWMDYHDNNSIKNLAVKLLKESGFADKVSGEIFDKATIYIKDIDKTNLENSMNALHSDFSSKK